MQEFIWTLGPLNIVNDCKTLFLNKNLAVVVAQLVVRSLPTPDYRGSNTVISYVIVVNSKTFWKDKIKKKVSGDGPINKIIKFLRCNLSTTDRLKKPH